MKLRTFWFPPTILRINLQIFSYLKLKMVMNLIITTMTMKIPIENEKRKYNVVFHRVAVIRKKNAHFPAGLTCRLNMLSSSRRLAQRVSCVYLFIVRVQYPKTYNAPLKINRFHSARARDLTVQFPGFLLHTTHSNSNTQTKIQFGNHQSHTLA